MTATTTNFAIESDPLAPFDPCLHLTDADSMDPARVIIATLYWDHREPHPGWRLHVQSWAVAARIGDHTLESALDVARSHATDSGRRMAIDYEGSRALLPWLATEGIAAMNEGYRSGSIEVVVSTE